MSASPLPLPTAAAVAVAVPVGLIVFMDWVPTALNRNVAGTPAGERLPGSLIHLSVGAGIVVNWWLPYLTGLTVGEIDVATFQAEYAANPHLLPAIGGYSVVPDVQHMLIHLAVLTSCAPSWSSGGPFLRWSWDTPGCCCCRTATPSSPRSARCRCFCAQPGRLRRVRPPRCPVR